MRAEIIEIGKGIRIENESFFEVIVNSGTDDDPDKVRILVDISHDPKELIGKEAEFTLNFDSFIPSPLGDNKTLIVSQGVKLV